MPEMLDTSTERPRIRRLSWHRPSHFELSRKNGCSSNNDASSILTNPHYNKGTAFTLEERNIFHLEGLLPATVETLQTQINRCIAQLDSIKVPISKYIYLNALRERNATLFYAVLVERLEEIMPFIYTPTVGQACQMYGLEFRQQEGMYISKSDFGNIRRILDNWKRNALNEVAIIVVTDGSRILGLGDLGAYGMGIPIGKLSLYVGVGGFHPTTTLPVLIDTGTNNVALLKDEFYLGKRHLRLDDVEFYELMDEFMTAVKDKWPKALVQFEDFSNNHCFTLLKKYREKQLCFNDDIQGTGAVVAAGFLNALRITNTEFKNCRVVFLGAGAAGIGVADQINSILEEHFALPPEVCRKVFYMVDSKGLITKSRRGLSDFKIPYARDDIKENLTDLMEILKRIKPSALIGLSGQRGAFTKDILTFMGHINKRPIIFALSNPTANAECTFEEVLRATDDRAIFAAGSPFPSIMRDDKTILKAAQGNNLYTFPGLGFGAWLSRAKMVTDEMITTATKTLANSVSNDDLKKGLLYPPLSQVRETSAVISARVIECAIEQGLAEMTDKSEDYLEYVRQIRYEPQYLEWKL